MDKTITDEGVKVFDMIMDILNAVYFKTTLLRRLFPHSYLEVEDCLVPD